MSNDHSKTFDQILAEEKAVMQAEQQANEEKVREEREQNLRRAAAVNYDALQTCFINADISSQEGTDKMLNSINTATAVLKGEQPSLLPVPVATSDIPFDWGKMDSDQRESILLIAANKKRFYVKPSGALVDKKGRELNQAHLATNQPTVVPEEPAKPATSEGNDMDAPAPEPEPTPAPTPAAMPAKKAVAKKTAAVPATDTPAQPSGDETSGTDDGKQKKQPFGARLKAATKKAVNSLD